MKPLLLIVSTFLLMSGCGFKSDLYLPDRQSSTLPEAPLELPELPTLPSTDDLENPGVNVEIPPLEEKQTDAKKKK